MAGFLIRLDWDEGVIFINSLLKCRVFFGKLFCRGKDSYAGTHL